MKPAKKANITRRKAMNDVAYKSSSILSLNMTLPIKKHTQNSIVVSILLSALLFFSSCTKSTNYDFESSQAALSFYKDYHRDLKSRMDLSSPQLVVLMDEWKDVADTVYHFLQKDPAFLAHAGLSMDYTAISDSIKMEFMRLAYDGTYGLKDLAILKFSGRNISPAKDLKSNFESSSAFFEQLIKENTVRGNNQSSDFASYVRFLDTYKESNFDLNLLKKFIMEEDIYFQEYLNRIDENINQDLTLITKKTEGICQRIFLSANDGLLSDTTALVYMAMRTNRRLVLNAQRCMDLIKKNQVYSSEQANVYLWMLIQPFLSIDQFSASLLTTEQRHALFVLAESYNEAAKKMVNRGFWERDVVDVLPTRIIKLYITTL